MSITPKLCGHAARTLKFLLIVGLRNWVFNVVLIYVFFIVIIIIFSFIFIFN